MDGYTDSNIIQFLSTFFFDVTFRNCAANEVGRFRKTGKVRKSPIHLDLDRAIWDGFYPHAGVVTFENFTVNGYRDVPLVSVTDKNGKYGVNTFRGTINHNGKEVDMSTFSYLPPDRDLSECADPDLAKLAAPEGDPPAVYHRSFNFSFHHSFYNPTPRYQLFSRGEKGRKATFSIEARGRVRPEAEFKVTTPSGATKSLGKAVQGANAYEYVFPEDGMYLFDANFPPDTRDEEYNPDGFTVLSATGVAFAYQAGATRLGKVVSLSTGDDYPKYVGYFEVPGGKECCIKMQGGGIEIRDEEGEVVQRLEKGDYSGNHTNTASSATATPILHDCNDPLMDGTTRMSASYLRNSCLWPSSLDYSGHTSVLVADPQFRSRARGDLHIRSSSPCRDTGRGASIAAGAVDLDGLPRIFGKAVDMGCYESFAKPGTFLFVK